MARQTIDFGINLGVTDSVIAMATGSDAVVARNSDGEERTPSTVYVSEKDQVYAGRGHEHAWRSIPTTRSPSSPSTWAVPPCIDSRSRAAP
jgi:molecular chaperone DnaK (HSP70)